MRIETLAVHAGHAVDEQTGAVTPPIHLSTTFVREDDGSYRAGYVYSRYANPNRAALEQCLAALEGGAAALTFASGSAATAAVLQALESGAHVILPRDAYFGSIKLARDQFARWGLEYSLVDMTTLDAVERAIRPNTRLVWIESPSNPLLNLADIAAIARLARAAGARSVVDNTWATPVLQRPLDLGADVAMHSTTKYLNGHSDVLGGALVFRADDDFTASVRAVQGTIGSVPSPFDCWLTLRGIRPLPWRVRGQTANANALARYLAAHQGIERVNYPGLPTHPQHELARRQMSDFGGMMSIQVRGGRAEAMRVAARLQLFTTATSLGGTESLVEHRASVEGPDTLSPENLLRVSVGLENAEDLVEDWGRALG